MDVSEGTSLWALTVSSVVTTAFSLPLGMLGDRVDRKRMLCWMWGLFAAFHLIMVLAQDFGQVVILMGLAGVPMAALAGVGYAFYLDLIPEERTAEFVGIHAVSVYAGSTVGVLIGGMLIDTLGYRSMFPASAIFFAAALLVFLLIRPPGRREAQR
jgi:predicted MFS family arabinose efflux permease